MLKNGHAEMTWTVPILCEQFFSKNYPVLAFNNLTDQSDLDEQEGMMHLFEGAVLGIRNPRGHDFLDDSPERAMESNLPHQSVSQSSRRIESNVANHSS